MSSAQRSCLSIDVVSGGFSLEKNFKKSPCFFGRLRSKWENNTQWLYGRIKVYRVKIYKCTFN